MYWIVNNHIEIKEYIHIHPLSNWNEVITFVSNHVFKYNYHLDLIGTELVLQTALIHCEITSPAFVTDHSYVRSHDITFE